MKHFYHGDFMGIKLSNSDDTRKEGSNIPDTVASDHILSPYDNYELENAWRDDKDPLKYKPAIKTDASESTLEQSYDKYLVDLVNYWRNDIL